MFMLNVLHVFSFEPHHKKTCLQNNWFSHVSAHLFAAPEGTCPAPSSTVFEGLCNHGCRTDGRCDGGKICCHSDYCSGDVCVMPEETQSKRVSV